MANPEKSSKYPKELEEISEKLLSGLPPISLDDVLDVHVALKKYCISVKRKNARKRNDSKSRRVSL